MMHKACIGIEEVLYYFSRSSVIIQGHTSRQIDDLAPMYVFLDDKPNLNLWMAIK